MRSRARWFVLPLAALVLTGAAQDMPEVPDGAPSGSSQRQPGEIRVDEVGQASAHGGPAPERITAYAAHRTLGKGSFVEVTALDSGRTILLAVTDGEVPAGSIVALSPAAAAQLGVDLASPVPVRVRLVQPSAQDEAALASGGAAPVRLDAPKALLSGLRMMAPAAPASLAATPAAPPTPAPTPTPTSAPTPTPTPTTSPAPAPRQARQPVSPPANASTGKFVVQVGSFANAANAKALSNRLGGFTTTSGRLTLVRMGPFESRADANAARERAVAAGYRDTTIIRAD